MRLYCLGSTGFHPSPSRHTACYYLPEQSLVLDAGTGIFRLVQHLLDEPKRALTILLSHAHLDHVVGLTFLVDALAVTDLEEITLIGEEAKLEVIKNHLYQELLFPVAPSFKFVPLQSSSFEIGSANVQWFPLEHPGGSVGYRLELSDNGRKKQMAYVTDTVSRLEADYVSQIENLDLLLHECYFSDEHQGLAIKTGHSWISEVRRIVEKVSPKKTFLVHINPLAEILNNGFHLAANDKDELCIELAEDGLEITF